MIWMGHAGHLIVGNYCRFHLTTYVNGYIVSTVGEYYPPHDTPGGKPETIGSGRLYETMVFKARKSPERCCPFEIKTGSNLDFDGYNDPGAATAGHMRLVRKWSRKKR